MLGKRKALKQKGRAASKRQKKDPPAPKELALNAHSWELKASDACQHSHLPLDIIVHLIARYCPWELSQVCSAFRNMLPKFEFNVATREVGDWFGVLPMLQGCSLALCVPSSDVLEQTAVYSFPLAGRPGANRRPVFYNEPWYITNYFSDTYVWNAEDRKLVAVPTGMPGGNEPYWVSTATEDYVMVFYDTSDGKNNHWDDLLFPRDEEGNWIEEFGDYGDCICVEGDEQILSLIPSYPPSRPRAVRYQNVRGRAHGFPNSRHELIGDSDTNLEECHAKYGCPLGYDQVNEAFANRLPFAEIAPGMAAFYVGCLFDVRTGAYARLYQPYRKILRFPKSHLTVPHENAFGFNEEILIGSIGTEQLLKGVLAHNKLFGRDGENENEQFLLHYRVI